MTRQKDKVFSLLNKLFLSYPFISVFLFQASRCSEPSESALRGSDIPLQEAVNIFSLSIN